MRFTFTDLLLLVSSPVVAIAKSPWTEPRLCYDACQSCLASLRFGNESLQDASESANGCTNLLGLASLYLCLSVYCESESRTLGLGVLNQTCRHFNNVSIPTFDLIANYTTEDIKRLRRIESGDSSEWETVNEVVIPSDHFHRIWLKTLSAVAYMDYYHHAYGRVMIVFWVVVVAVGVLNHLASHIASSQAMRRHSFRYVWDKFTWIRSSIDTPATFGYRCAQKIGWGTLPPRLQSLTLFAFLMVNIVLSICSYRIFPGNMYFADTTQQLLRYVSDRTGIISFYNFPIIWLFGMRNNVLMWLTGWDFGTYNNFHRWVARIATLQAVVHSLGYSAFVVREGGWAYFVYWWTDMFWWAGEIATICMSLLIGFSFYWIRRQQYEPFLIIHILLSVIVLVAMLGHVSIFGGDYDIFFWVPVYVWILDRTLRALRIIAFNPKFWSTMASATYDPSSNIICLHVPWSTSLYRPKPGTFYYIHILSDARFWESHPFTVASVSDSDQAGPGESLAGEQTPLLEPEHTEPCCNMLDGQQRNATYPQSMAFLVRPYDGFTSRLRDVASNTGPQKAPLRVLIDGPYGHTQPFHLFDNVLFIVGGSGIVVPLSYLKILTRGAVRPSHVRIHWAVREAGFALDVLRNNIRDALGMPNLSVEIYITSHAQGDGRDWPPQVTLRSGRIDARSIVGTVAEQADGASVAVVACGPAQMSDDVRGTVVDIVAKGQTPIEYFEEAFQW